jgi:hypothetical protein
MTAKQKELLKVARQANERGHTQRALNALLEIIAIECGETEQEREDAQLPANEVCQG